MDFRGSEGRFGRAFMVFLFSFGPYAVEKQTSLQNYKHSHSCGAIIRFYSIMPPSIELY